MNDLRSLCFPSVAEAGRLWPSGGGAGAPLHSVPNSNLCGAWDPGRDGLWCQGNAKVWVRLAWDGLLSLPFSWVRWSAGGDLSDNIVGGMGATLSASGAVDSF